ncbi:type II toxin-antitoxin system RelE/ParE family toxin [Mucilaginibacter ximonensis]|uniref:Type II toxin-antitoxin system RelE/ParE family toxin n=1 Tax=Mucilaginibacter ximonensis TaxID=538021 RepID=A0ABW5YCA0_9SPHI
MAQRIVFSKKAEIDLERIIEFNNRRNQSDTYSKKLFSRLNRRLKLLLKQPFSGIRTDFDQDYLGDPFLLVWDAYYIFYTYNGIILEVARIYHQKENIHR